MIEAERQPKFQHSCGTNNPPNARFCSGCGAALNSNVAPQTQPSGLRSRKYFVLGISAFVLICLLLGVIFGGSPSATEFALGEAKRLERELNLPNSDFGKRVESMHVTVTFKRATVRVSGIKTTDGSDQAGNNGRNVLECSYVITANWDGYIQKDGATEMEIVWDNQAKLVKSTRLLRSSALINTETIDWEAVGYTVGTLIKAWYFR